MTVRRPGRPKRSEPKPGALSKVTFKLDAATAQALADLEAATGEPAIRGRTSKLLRKLILDAHRAILEKRQP